LLLDSLAAPTLFLIVWVSAVFAAFLAATSAVLRASKDYWVLTTPEASALYGMKDLSASLSKAKDCGRLV
jgi:hypothetical protein